MSKKYFVINKSDGWTTHQNKVEREGLVREGIEDHAEKVVHRSVDGRKTFEGVTGATTGLSGTDMHMAGDRIVVTGEVVERGGDIIQTVERYDDNGKFRGTYEIPWHKEGSGRHRADNPRRVHH